LSLDATNPLAVWAARTFFHLPYHRAAISITERSDGFEYTSRRRGAEFEATYRPSSAVYRAEPGTLEHFLTERYCLYAQTPRGALLRNDVHHLPWPLQRATATLRRNTMLDAHGVEVVGAPLLHFAKRVDVAVWDAEHLR
jgi:uncharacterized protein YqjF (DUF2071 family)